ncbi:hypothetical protein BDV26DRAFT_294125 [Aspergillus bertholletiae]|uniref:Uncharacterized protein n=1 Tax=Aspergillus bertholletiae TaxID=1226010 RepID=A0A5N7B2N8_9EURO|nr:hypothetical protein BDV26DRAFT_294125 [Aspergillus bertholletiae]
MKISTFATLCFVSAAACAPVTNKRSEEVPQKRDQSAGDHADVFFYSWGEPEKRDQVGANSA